MFLQTFVDSNGNHSYRGEVLANCGFDLHFSILKEVGIPDHLIFLLRNLYAGQEATVTTKHGTMDWFQIGKGLHQACISSPCLFNLCAEKCWAGLSTNWNQDCWENYQ